MKHISTRGGIVAALAMMPMLALVGAANGSSVAGTSLPVAVGQVARTGVTSTRKSNSNSLWINIIALFIRASIAAELIIQSSPAWDASIVTV